MTNKLHLILNRERFTDFIEKLQNLSSIDDTIKIKIDSENIFMYSMLSNDSAVLALKNYIMPTNYYIDNFKSDETFDFIITGAGKFVKNLKFFNASYDIKLDMSYKKSDEPAMHIRSAQFSNNKLKISCIGSELSKIKDMNKKSFLSLLDVKNSKWNFKISLEDFSNVKKLSSINSEDKIINIKVNNNGKVYFIEEQKWELEVDETEIDSEKFLTFSKKYLSNIDSNSDIINFNIFETFILVKDVNSNLMLSFEQTYDED